MIMSDAWSHWPKAIVPFTGVSHSPWRSMRTIERFTCIRFKDYKTNLGPHKNLTTNQFYHLGHRGFIRFGYWGGCHADQGFKNNANGQQVSCCGNIVCLHETFHALGLYHEQQNPLAQRGYIRVNPSHLDPGHLHNFAVPGNNWYSEGYDPTSLMGYDQWMWNNGKGPSYSYLFADGSLFDANQYFYTLRESSEVHNCKDQCAGWEAANNMTCYNNDGYLTLVDGKCGCHCPPGLDPRTGCKDTLQKQYTTADVKWPAGKWAMPMPKDGCPDSLPGLKEGGVIMTGNEPKNCEDKSEHCQYWFDTYKGCDDNPAFMHDNCARTCGQCRNYGNFGSSKPFMKGTTNTTQVETNWCMKTDTSGDDAAVHWAPGQFCYQMIGGKCPWYMDKGKVRFFDADWNNATNEWHGDLPDGDFSENSTRLDFCCSIYGFNNDAFVLPNDQPFAMWATNDNQDCQKIRGMHKYTAFMVHRNNLDKMPHYSWGARTPSTYYNEARHQDKFNYCYYRPVNSKCGGVIELNDTHTSAAIEGKEGPEWHCNWLITAPEGSRVVLKFTEYDLMCSGSYWKDTLTIRQNLLGSGARHLACGKKMSRSYSSIKNKMMLTYDTYQFTPNSHFKATVSLISQNINACYNFSDHGATYAGPAAYTRGMKPCVPWAQATKCKHNPFNWGDDFHANLEGATCRTPNKVDGLRPWCYTDANSCERDYCDVCSFEDNYDTDANCDILAQSGFCTNAPESEVVRRCAATCWKVVPMWPRSPAKYVQCDAPPQVYDATLSGDTKTTYSVGDKVTYTCKLAVNHATHNAYCLSTGVWTPILSACTDCKAGWRLYDGRCYKMFWEWVTWDTASRKCSAIGGKLAKVDNWQISNFLLKLTIWDDFWIGLHDKAHENQFQFQDGTPIGAWKPWEKNQPDNWYNEDCVRMSYGKGTWADRWCDKDTFPYICGVPAMAKMTSVCTDVSGSCQRYLVDKPDACSDGQTAEFMQKQCADSCGNCSATATGTVCYAPSLLHGSSSKASVTLGQYLNVTCEAGYSLADGATSTKLACLNTGQLSASVACTKDPVETNTDVNLGNWKYETSEVFSNSTVTGVKTLTINVTGRVVAWSYYSQRAGKGALQIWRPTADPHKFTFIGQNEIQTLAKVGVQKWYVRDSRQIAVQPGDFVGLWSGKPAIGIGYAQCGTDALSSQGTVKQIKDTGRYSAATAFTPMQTYSFEDASTKPCRWYKIHAFIQTS